MTAPAEMPGVEEMLRRILKEALIEPEPEAIDFAVENIKALFAQILAEKERDARMLAERWDAYGVKMENDLLDERESRLAAEAALAAERERCALIAANETIHPLGEQIAAAIRAEGE